MTNWVVLVASCFAGVCCGEGANGDAISTGMIHERGYWLDDSDDGHHFDRGVAKAIAELCRGRTVLDVGCGRGDYVRYFRAMGIDCTGCDGNPYTMLVDDSLLVIDLSRPIKLDQLYDWVISLEVGEHIPAKYESIFIDNLCQHSRHGLVVTWASPGQAGRGHVNCRAPDYIRGCIERRGYSYDEPAAMILRRSATLEWLKASLLVFRKGLLSLATAG